jgi:hypothetical protein
MFALAHTKPAPPPFSHRTRLGVERLEDRSVPAVFNVRLLSPPEGVRGSTAASYVSGGLFVKSVYDPDGDGTAVVDAVSELEAIREAVTGGLTVGFGGTPANQMYSYLNPSTVGLSVSEHKPFVVRSYVDMGGVGWTIHLEDLAAFPASCDWDYNDFGWGVAAWTGGGSPPPPPPPPPPTTGVATGDLDIIDSNGLEVAEDKENNPGGWVSVNNDNDNYNFIGDQATSREHKLDKDESSKVVGENDLIKIVAKDLDPHGLFGTFSLEWTSPNIRVWKTADKDGAALTGITLTPGQANNFWVEGLSLSSSMAAEKIQLKWTDMTAGVQAVDQVDFTVYEVNGSMNVPGYSKYKYQAQVPENSGYVPIFVSATSGTVTNDWYGGGPPGTPITTKATVYWGAGEVVGTYRVTPGTAVSNFFVDREVNVVKITVTSAATPLRNEVKLANPTTNPPIQKPGGKRVKSVTKDYAMGAYLSVEEIKGPLVGDSRRGVRFMEVGFIQNVFVEQSHGVFDGLAPAKKQVSPMEGKSYLDCMVGAAAITSTPPWYDTKGASAPTTEGVPPGALKGVFTAGNQEGGADATCAAWIAISDTPTLLGTGDMSVHTTVLRMPLMSL